MYIYINKRVSTLVSECVQDFATIRSTNGALFFAMGPKRATLDPQRHSNGTKSQRPVGMCTLCCPVVPFLFLGKGSPLNSTNKNGLPFFPNGHRAFEHMWPSWYQKSGVCVRTGPATFSRQFARPSFPLAVVGMGRASGKHRARGLRFGLK